ncbi:MAG: hypothetical protein ACI9LX_004508, partial [Paraglaciecola sp.]
RGTLSQDSCSKHAAKDQMSQAKHSKTYNIIHS